MTDIEIIHEIEKYFGIQLNRVKYENLKNKKIIRVNRIEGTRNYSINDKGEIDGICLDFCQKPLPTQLIESLQNIRLLSLRNSFSRRTINLTIFRKLESLDLCINKLSDISFLSNIKTLVSIDLSHNKLTNISILGRLKELTTLDLSYNTRFNDLTPLVTLVKLSSLDLSHNELYDISFLKELKELTTLNLQETNIKLKNINSFGEIKDLGNRNNYIVLKDLKRLKILDLSKVYSINDFSFIAELTELNVLKLDENYLSSADFLNNLTKLNSLSLRKNKIRDIAFLKKLKELISVDLSNNTITDISILKELDNLKDIQLKKNQINEIPDSLLKFNLNINIDDKFAPNCINLYDNPIEKPDLVTIRQGYKAIKNWYKSTKIIKKEIKLIFVGNRTVGKTSLLEFLKENKNPQNKPTTHGISVSTWSPKKLNLHVNMWDFGNQEYYHTTHRLFLSNGAIYILVWERKTDCYLEEDTSVYNENSEEAILLQRYYDKEYWLQTIRENISTDSEILLVQNKIDEQGNGPIQVDPNLLSTYKVKAQYTISIYDAYKYNITLDTKFETNFLRFKIFNNELLKLLEEKAKEQEFVKHTDIIRNKILIHKKDNYWSWDEYYSFCNREAEEKIDKTQIDILTDYLNRTGVIIYYGYDPNFNNNELLKNVVFLNPNFVTQSIYNILSSDVRKANGKFNRQYAIDMIGNSNIANCIIELMRSSNFELIFNYDIEPDIFYATSYLPENYPETMENFDFDSAGLKTSLIIYFYQYFTPSFFSRFLSSFGNRTIKGKVWKSGIFLAKDDKKALVECLFDERKIEVKSNNSDFVKDIFDEFIRIIDKTDFEISINGNDHFVSYTDLQRNILENYEKFQYKKNHIICSDYFHLFNKINGNILPTVVILTAINEEYIAVRNNIENWEKIYHKGDNYEKGIFKFNDKDIANVIIRKCGSGNIIVAEETLKAIWKLKPDLLLFVGIAGSWKPANFSIGDVIIPDKIYYYERGKSEENSFNARPELYKITDRLLNMVACEKSNCDWKKHIINNWGYDFKVGIGTIASGEQIVEHHDSPAGDIITRYYSDTSAVETEGYGFLDSAYRNGENIPVAVIRGISDIIGSQENNNRGKGEMRPQSLKDFASATAAAFAFRLIDKFYNNEAK